MSSSVAPRSSSNLLSSISCRTTTPHYIHARSSLQSSSSFSRFSRCLLLSGRPFSNTTQREASMRDAQILRPKAPPVMSGSNQMKKLMQKMDADSIPDDLGLLPGTFIRPLWRHMPSIFKYPKERLWMEWVSLRSKFQDFVGVVAYCKYLDKKHKLPLRLRERKRVALDLHKSMYTALAAADTATLQNICCSGLYTNFSNRIARRPEHAKKLIWTLDKYIKFPFSMTLTGARVITDRAANIGHGVGIRQIVVRIQSRQTLSRTPPPVTKEAQSKTPVRAKQQDSTEYIVLQRMVIGGKEKNWKVWGLASATTMEDMETNPAFAQGLSLKDRLELISGSSKFGGS
ncbi:hypothetical protein PAAG_05887 [Paracoccidioides lutzii Pb01]|uniref:Tim44-like domain-containing protein n=1 Tax=Paracoccidioides lutzii (strain ATCC MYA-826 / Pb01) TaxID=502779 RepID=C1H546_PARBA|nr:hypothetical protein PAAG_05887 [Paracoccidioides lutzii Pb01]EEH34840.1 hypothetical protein PAAG_05887 [Paracoccidioides lutzii Pb01]